MVEWHCSGAAYVVVCTKERWPGPGQGTGSKTCTALSFSFSHQIAVHVVTDVPVRPIGYLFDSIQINITP